VVQQPALKLGAGLIVIRTPGSMPVSSGMTQERKSSAVTRVRVRWDAATVPHSGHKASADSPSRE